jgi:adenylylsulfate kinase
VKCPLEVCESRDVKGLYALARAGKIKNYTGISAPYEQPEKPDLVIETHTHSVDESVKIIVQFILGILHLDAR